MKKIILYLISCSIFFSLHAYSNTGHRLGVDSAKCNHLPENSIDVFKCAINKNIKEGKGFNYFELDIQESRSEKGMSCEYFVFHNQSDSHKLIDLVPDKKNETSYKVIMKKVHKRMGKEISLSKLRIEHMTPVEIKKLVAEQNGIEYEIPTLDEILKLAIENDLNKVVERETPVKILIEIKRMRTEACRDALVNKLVMYQGKGLNLGFLVRLPGGSKGSKGYKSIGRPKPSKTKIIGGLEKWCNLIENTKLFISTTYPHYDMCNKKKKIEDMQKYKF